jgi:hypothetical protein
VCPNLQPQFFPCGAGEVEELLQDVGHNRIDFGASINHRQTNLKSLQIQELTGPSFSQVPRPLMRCRFAAELVWPTQWASTPCTSD